MSAVIFEIITKCGIVSSCYQRSKVKDNNQHSRKLHPGLGESCFAQPGPEGDEKEFCRLQREKRNFNLKVVTYRIFGL